ncbi:glucosaminidase domain-containing protein [Cytobacillus massiliigabonensis]|uniref:glucosaminidase domain-containing protein n=1 Tax=Cytobacillus massiliigabonensis TaxID=1871011 RepID=UPI000C83A6F6|nr:glucosaminidase domain-containing protein [Cytobacillus massiliigabonensis]
MSFIDRISPHAVKYMKSEGILASLTIAQAILESDSGISELAVEANNLFGIKAGPSWSGQVYELKTKEFEDGKWIEVLALFCHFTSIEECIEYRSSVFLKRSRYIPLWGINDYKEASRVIYECGYATDPSYPQKLIDVIEKYELYHYDKEESNLSVTTACRDISELHPTAQTACKLFLEECNKAGLDIFITETYRSQERQNYLYEQGRTRPGKVVTWTRNSNHKSRLAWDIACNKPSLYDVSTLKKAGQIAMSLGIGWGGVWKTPDMPHFEVTTSWKAPKKEEVKKEEIKLYQPTSKSLMDHTENVLTDLTEEKKHGDKALNKSWLDKFKKGTLTESDAIGLLYVAADRKLL